MVLLPLNTMLFLLLDQSCLMVGEAKEDLKERRVEVGIELCTVASLSVFDLKGLRARVLIKN